MKEKLKTKKNKPFFVAIVMLVVSAIVITTASFAWFTLGRNVGVREMDVKISSKEGIVISGNTNEFTDFLNKDELDGTNTTSTYRAYAGNTNVFPDVISPSSSNFQFGVGSLPAFFTGGISSTATGDKEMETIAVTNSNGIGYPEGHSATYYVFDVFVKYEGEREEFTVNVGDSTIKVKQDTTAGSPTQNAEVEKSMRLGFVNLGVVSGDPGSTYSKNGVRIFAPGRVDGTASSISPIGSEGKSTSVSGSVATGGSILSSYPSGSVAPSGNDATMTLAKGINRVRVYVWMEGQDSTCTDEMVSQLVSVAIEFKMA